MSKDHYCPSQDWDSYCRHNYNPPREVNSSLYFEWLIESCISGFLNFRYNFGYWFKLINSSDSEPETFFIVNFWYYLNRKYCSFEEYVDGE